MDDPHQFIQSPFQAPQASLDVGSYSNSYANQKSLRPWLARSGGVGTPWDHGAKGREWRSCTYIGDYTLYPLEQYSQPQAGGIHAPNKWKL